MIQSAKILQTCNLIELKLCLVFIFFEELKILKLYGSTNISVSQRSNLSLSLEDESPEQFLFEDLNIVRNTKLTKLPELPEFPVSSRLKTNRLAYRTN